VLKRLLLTLLALVSFISTLLGQPYDPALYHDLRWRLIGPFRGGRTVAITGIPGAQNIFYMAPNNGGVWKSSDFGRTWNPIFDPSLADSQNLTDARSGSIGALAVAPSNPNIIYVGSGEGLRRPDLSTGNGMYKSIDAGLTWQHLGLRDAQQISSIIVDPKDPDRLFVAVQGHPYGPSNERGIFRSLDGGLTFQKVLYKDENAGGMDLVFDPLNPRTIYASLWSSRRPPWTTGLGYYGPGSGLFKSTDGGDHWHQLTRGLPGEAEGIGRIGPTVAPSDPSRLYAWVNTSTVNGKNLSGIYRSDDAGESWQLANNEDRIYGRGDDFGCVRVDPRNKDVILLANTSTYRSTDAGQSFSAIKGAPGGDDYHTVWINPENPDIIALGVDQGATISVNGGQTWSSWYNQPTAQFYHVVTDDQFPYWVYGGQQESGSIGTASRSDFGEITFRDWTTVGTEEYGYVAPDPLHPNLIYGGKGTVFDRNTGETRNVEPVVLRTGQYRYNRTAPLIFSKADPHILYLGANVLFSTRDGGNSWQTISPDLTREDPGVPATLGVFVNSDPAKGKHRGVIYSIAPSPEDANLIWIGTDDGLIQVTRDGGKNWQNVTPKDLTPWSKIAQLDASHFDPSTVYAAVNRFRLDDLHPYVYRTHDGGATWQKIVNGLPDEPVNTVREDPERKGLLFAGTERTVYVSFDDGDHWQSLQQNLPPSSIRDLVVHSDDIVVGTHGRSFWILDNITPLRQLKAESVNAPAFLFKPQITYRVRRDNNTDTPLPPEEPAGQNPPDGVMFDYWIGNLNKSLPYRVVTLEIVDSAGNMIRRFSSTDKPEPVNAKDFNVPMYWVRPSHVLSAEPGMHRFVWDLTYPTPDVLSRDYPISAIYHDTPLYPRGAVILPGKYTVTITMNSSPGPDGGAVAVSGNSQKLEIRMDPRVKVSPEDLRRHFDFDRKIADSLHRDFEAIERIHSLLSQLKPLGGKDVSPQIKSVVAPLYKKSDDIVGKPGGFGTGFLTTPEGRSLSRLNSGFGTMLQAFDSSDDAPTTQQVAMFDELNKALDEKLSAWNQLKSKDIPALNDQLKKSGAPTIDPDQHLSSASVFGLETTTQDRDED
jgi:photosystem II stability/assembly factor-like uncharacterized protein